jgi:hypothetical protein
MASTLDESVILSPSRRARQSLLLIAPMAAAFHGCVVLTQVPAVGSHRFAFVIYAAVFMLALVKRDRSSDPDMRRLLDEPDDVTAITYGGSAFRINFADGVDMKLGATGIQAQKVALALGRHCRRARIDTPWVKRTGRDGSLR